MTLNEVLLRFGTDAEVCSLLRVGRPALSNWRQRGALPPGRALQILRLAKQRGLRIRLDDLPVNVPRT